MLCLVSGQHEYFRTNLGFFPILGKQNRHLILQMITSSKFFEKAFFTIDYPAQRYAEEEVSPWNPLPLKSDKFERHQVNPQSQSNKNIKRREPLVTNNVSLRHIAPKIAQSLQPQRPKEQSYQIYKTIERDRQQEKIRQIRYKKQETLEQKLKKVEQRHNSRFGNSVQVLSKLKKSKKRAHLFPEITLNQYNDLKAQGSGILSNNSFEQVLERRKNRKKLYEQFGSAVHKTKKLKDFLTRSIENKGILSGRYVYAIKNPQFSVNGLTTAKMGDD